MSLAETSLQTITQWPNEVLLAEITHLESHVEHVYGKHKQGDRYIALDRLIKHVGFERDMREIAEVVPEASRIEQTADQLRPFVRGIL
jgi:hypothetical protein